MRRLYVQVYLTVLGVLLLLVVLGSIAWMAGPSRPRERQLYTELALLLSEILPEAGAPPERLGQQLQRFGQRFEADLSVFDADGELLASYGEPLPVPDGGGAGHRWLHTGTGPPALSLQLPDGRFFVARHPHRHDDAGLGWLAALGLLAVAVGVGAYPVVRRLTGRLERLQARVEALGAGELSARVKVEGRDEVADLARSFNDAADRIERLVNGQKTLLASASHELRTPLARMRVAIELLAGDDRPELRDRMSRDIAELDELIGELLLASRLGTIDELERSEEVDLLALLAEEAARSGAEASGEPLSVRGDRRMLRRLLRNLLENARRYGEGSPVEASLARIDGRARVRVEDRGPGIPESERERIFEPFYRLPGARETGEGTGLGLALVRQIAAHHGGDARCLAREGGGIRFEVTLPLSEDS